MKEIIILDQLINETNNKIKLFRKLLSDHENGENTLSKVIKAATEASLEEANDKAKKYKEMLDNISIHDNFTDIQKEKILKILEKNKIYNDSEENIKQKYNSTYQNKLKTMMLIDEISSEIELDNDQLFKIASKSLFLTEEEKVHLEDKFSNIITNFKEQLKKIDKNFTKNVSSFNYRIPILILHFNILIESVKNSFEKLNKEFKGFPKYEDWWISELWSSHQSYYGVYKMKEIITLQCLTIEQKKSWEMIFDNWLSIKLFLHSKGDISYPYMLAFDTILSSYTGFEEEINEENLKSMDTFINTKIVKENFTKISPNHTIITSYMRFKKKIILKESLDNS